MQEGTQTILRMFGDKTPTSPSPLSTQRSSTKGKQKNTLQQNWARFFKQTQQAVQLQTASTEQFDKQGLTTQLPFSEIPRRISTTLKRKIQWRFSLSLSWFFSFQMISCDCLRQISFFFLLSLYRWQSRYQSWSISVSIRISIMINQNINQDINQDMKISVC